MKKEVNLFLGSSIIYQWDTCYYFSDYNNLNLGVEGLTIESINKSFYPKIDTVTSMKIKNIIVYIGSNDIVKNNSKVENILSNIISFLFFLRETFPKSNIIYIAILKTPRRTDTQKKKLDYINKKMKDYSQKTNIFHFCNFNRELQYNDNYQIDRNHLSKKGYTILSHHLLSFISSNI